MKIQPIDIQIENNKENNWKFTHIALFVDQTIFLEDLYEGRKYFQVPEQLIPGSLLGEWLETAFEFEENNGLGQSRKRIDVRYPHVDQFVLKVLNKHKKSTMFSNVVRHTPPVGFGQGHSPALMLDDSQSAGLRTYGSHLQKN